MSSLVILQVAVPQASIIQSLICSELIAAPPRDVPLSDQNIGTSRQIINILRVLCFMLFIIVDYITLHYI